jgi:hypothetical protein
MPLVVTAPPDLAFVSPERRLHQLIGKAHPTSGSVRDPAQAQGSHQTTVSAE